ncbi:MAG TPA: nitrous oxide-stimulated promoter family protein [Anaerolineaceae bacterium]|nr:nitrous oxide-stimulated promoter family protein [Anaerolineaceae bacterium]
MEKEKVLIAEKKTISLMLGLYCRDQHGQKEDLCEECKQLKAYAYERLERCQFMPEKPVCAKCPVHCYKPYYRQQIREVMRYAGPRMLTHAPGAAMRHLWLMVKPDSPRVKQIRARIEK